MKSLFFNTFENQWNRRIFFLVLGVAISLRLILSVVNSAANDSHHEVTRMILETGKLPRVLDCWQCYHPKLYHLTCALFYKLIPVSEPSQIRIAQIINVVASLFLLGVLLKFIAQQQWSERIKLLVFSFFALNPGLIGINVQATNDTFVILFSSLSIYFIWEYIREPCWKYGGLTILFIILAALSKGSGLAIFLAALLVLGIQALVDLKKNTFWLNLKVGMALGFLFFLIVPFAGSYYANYERVGKNFTTNVAIVQKPFFFKKTYLCGAGVTSIFDTFFKFRFINMLQHPYVTYEDKIPLYAHRTSLWSHLYGKTISIHYDHWPPAWANTSPFVLNLVRAQLILGLFPFSMLLIGFVRDLIKKGDSALKWPPATNYIFLCFIAVMFTLYFKRICDHRDISVMKAIYIFPLIICFSYYFGEGMKWFFQKCHPAFVKIFEGGICILFLLGITDVLFLLPDLLPTFFTVYATYFGWLLN